LVARRIGGSNVEVGKLWLPIKKFKIGWRSKTGLFRKPAGSRMSCPITT
jgi:hypothetical protein